MDPVAPAKIYRCECHSHGIEVSKVYDLVELNVWYMHSENNGAWRTRWQRVKAAWRVLRTGTLYVDSVFLKPEMARALGEELIGG